MPTPEHIEALARVLDPANIRRSGYFAATPHDAATALWAAIATPGPAQDAVLAALIEGGVLREEREDPDCGNCGHLGEWHRCIVHECESVCHGPGCLCPKFDPQPTEKRLVTEWRPE